MQRFLNYNVRTYLIHDFFFSNSLGRMVVENGKTEKGMEDFDEVKKIIILFLLIKYSDDIYDHSFFRMLYSLRAFSSVLLHRL
jgi:hypothetical protein